MRGAETMAWSRHQQVARGYLGNGRGSYLSDGTRGDSQSPVEAEPLRSKDRGRLTYNIDYTRRMPVQRAALCIRNFPSQYRTHFRGLSGHNAGRFNATVFLSMLSGGELAFPLIARQPLTRHC